jgi:hypothetical protein
MRCCFEKEVFLSRLSLANIAQSGASTEETLTGRLSSPRQELRGRPVFGAATRTLEGTVPIRMLSSAFSQCIIAWSHSAWRRVEIKTITSNAQIAVRSIALTMVHGTANDTVIELPHVEATMAGVAVDGQRPGSHHWCKSAFRWGKGAA